MKFIHTADWQLGMPFVHVQAKADALRKARIDVVKQILALAERERADFVIAAGDLFDDNRIEPQYVEDMANAIKRSTVPVYLLPGNHDPFTQDSPYIRCPKLFDGNAVVLGKAEPLKINGGTLYPCPALSRKSNLDPTSWIPVRGADDGIRIGIAHGSLGTPSPNDFPINSKSATIHELDYLALGHFHGTSKIDDHTWYSGAPESTNFGQDNAGNTLVVEITEPKALPKVRQVAVGRYTWKTLEQELHSSADAAAFIKEVESLANPQTLLCLKIRGTLPLAETELIDKINGDRFFFVKRYIDIILQDQSFDYKNPLLKGILKSLEEKTSLPGEDSEIARRAISQLRLYVKHAGFRSEDS